MRAEANLKWKVLALGCGVAAALGLAPSAGIVHGQAMTGVEARDFKVQLENYPPPHEAQTKTQLEGANAEPQPGGILFLLTEAKLKTYSTNGALELQAEAPHCVFDRVERTINSPGPLRIKTADGSFSLEGRGFLLQLPNSNQTNLILTLSNRVHTVIRHLPGAKSF